jgi:hypothetical protein
MSEHFVVPSIQSREVTWAQRPNIRCLEHFLQLFDVVNGAINVHSDLISDIIVRIVKCQCTPLDQRPDKPRRRTVADPLKRRPTIREMMDWTQEQRCAAGYCLGASTAALTPAAILQELEDL